MILTMTVISPWMYVYTFFCIFFFLFKNFFFLIFCLIFLKELERFCRGQGIHKAAMLEYLRKIDTDSDGKISFEEFVKFMNN